MTSCGAGSRGGYRVLHAPSMVGGNPQGQSRALRRIGVDSIALALAKSVYSYPSDVVVWQGGERLPLRELKRWLAMLRYLPRADVVHYNFGTTLAAPPFFDVRQGRYSKHKAFCVYAEMLQELELRYLAFRKVPVFVTYQGDDARQGDYCRAHFEHTIAEHVDQHYYTAHGDTQKRRRIARMARQASKIYALNPDLLHVLPAGAEFLPYSHVMLDEWQPRYTQGEARPLRFVHAPSNRHVKGTQRVLEAFEALRGEGFCFESILVENMSNSQAMALYADADVLVDQLYAGWYGGLAVELMALGKPVVVYLREGDLGFVPEAMRRDFPFYRADSDTLLAVLREILLEQRDTLLQRAKASRAYVERWHDPLDIARRLRTDYEAALARIGHGFRPT